MLRILVGEGFKIKERELMRVRIKNRWLLRVANGTKGTSTARSPVVSELSDEFETQLEGQEHDESGMQELERAILADSDGMNSDNIADTETHSSGSTPGTLSQAQQQKRQQRLQRLQAESDEKWTTKKRRRRTRGWAGLPADPPGPPRFPSETTIDEGKAFLHMDNEIYRQIRDQFQQICEDAGFLKKTVAGPEKWQAAKDRLVSENDHLNKEFYSPINNGAFDSKVLALDVVCTDVTKRMRTLQRRMTIAEAKNALGINPEESRQIRDEFYAILDSDNFAGKHEAGTEHWQELKGQWIAGSAILGRILPLVGYAPDPQQAARVKAVEVLCRDVMKRYRDDQVRKDSTRKKQINIGPGPGPAPPRVTTARTPSVSSYVPTAAMMSSNTAALPHEGIHVDGQIDPSLLEAAADPGISDMEQLQHYATEGQIYEVSLPYSPSQSHQIPIPVLFRLSPVSLVQSDPKAWLSTMVTCSLAELRQCASGQHTHAMVQRVEGVMTDLGSAEESSMLVERDEDLMTYLACVVSSKPTFNVYLRLGYN